MKRIKKKIKQISIITIIFFLFQLFIPVFYEKLQAELYMSVSGKVVDKETGQPIEKALVIIFKVENEQLTERFDYYETNKEGRYIFDLVPPGEYWLFCHPPKESDYALDLTPKKVKVVRGRNVINVDFQLEIGGAISGTVYEADGRTPLANTPVIAVSENCANGATTDSSGNYEIKNLKTGAYIVGVIPFGYASIIKENNLVSKSQRLENININLSPNKTTCITGAVKSSTTGEPIKNALVAIFADKKGGLALTDAEGKYKICGLDEETYDIAVGGEGYEVKEDVNIQIISNQETIKDFNLVKQINQGFNYKINNKFGLKIDKSSLVNLILSSAYAQKTEDDVRCCFAECMREFRPWECLLPSNPLAWILVVLCGPMPTPKVAPWSGWIIKKYFQKLLPPLNAFCTTYNLGGIPMCFAGYALGCWIGCLE